MLEGVAEYDRPYQIEYAPCYGLSMPVSTLRLSEVPVSTLGAFMEAHVYPAFHSPSFHAHAVDLSIDPETGDVTIHKYVVAQDVGFAMNPTYIEGQIEGGVAQGLGQALSEEIVYENGRVLNPNLTDYKMPTTLDVPRVETILVQHPSLVGPYGAKGVGEPPNIEPPAAVANAVASATGLRLSSLPMTAEHIALALRDAGA